MAIYFDNYLLDEIFNIDSHYSYLRVLVFHSLSFATIQNLITRGSPVIEEKIAVASLR
jgi:hypothetical protein